MSAASVVPSTVLSFRDAAFGYGGATIVHGLTGAIRAGERLALLGPNGSGKSTLLKGIVGEARLLAGAIDLHGLPLSQVAYLRQVSEVDRDFPISLGEFVSMGSWSRSGAFGGFGRSGRERFAAALERVGLQDLSGRPIGTLSGGQMQRGLFARALLQDARLLLLDEPFSGIDDETAERLLALILTWGGEGRTIIAALHDLRHVRAAFDRTLSLAGGRPAWSSAARPLAAAAGDAAGRQG